MLKRIILTFFRDKLKSLNSRRREALFLLNTGLWPNTGVNVVFRCQSSISCATARPAVVDSEGPSSIIKGPNIRSFVAKSVLSRFMRFLVVTAQTKHCQIGQLHD